jgi:hypothetical protein
MMARGESGQAGTYDPKKGGKFEPTTKAEPPGDPHEGHGHKGTGQPKAKPPKR